MVAEACENLAHNLTLKIISSVPLQQLIKERDRNLYLGQGRLKACWGNRVKGLGKVK